MYVVARRDDGTPELIFERGYFYYISRDGRRYREVRRKITKKYVIVTFDLGSYKSKYHIHKRYVEHLISKPERTNARLDEFFKK